MGAKLSIIRINNKEKTTARDKRMVYCGVCHAKRIYKVSNAWLLSKTIIILSLNCNKCSTIKKEYIFT